MVGLTVGLKNQHLINEVNNMPKYKRFKTQYPGVYYIEGTSIANGKPERIYYMYYWRDGKKIEEKAGRQFQDDMTPAKANAIRSQKINRELLSNVEVREEKHNQANEVKWTIDRLWEEYKNNKPNLKGLKTDICRYNMHIKPYLGHKEPSELSPFDIDRIRINLIKTHAPQTVKHVLVLIKRIINFGVTKQICLGLNFKIEMPKVNNIKTEDLSGEQLKLLLDVLNEEENIEVADIMRLALFTGMRRGELFRLQWNDIDFQKGFITIRNPKGGIDQKIPLNNSARKVLENHPRTESPYVFPGVNGNERVNIKWPINRIKKKAGLPKDFRPLHGLRHVYASMLASSGQVDMYTLQKLLTHKSPQMTQRYAHLRDETLKRASNLMGELINQAINETQDNKVVSIEVFNK